MMLAFSGFCISHFNHPSLVLVAAHIPWLLAAIDVLVREPDRSKAAWAWLGISLLTASELLLGHFPTVWFSLLCEAAYSLFLVLQHGRMKRALALVVAKLLGFLAGSLQLVLAWQAMSLSTRGSPTVEFTSSFSLHPAFLLEFLDPRIYSSFFSAAPPGTSSCFTTGRSRWFSVVGRLSLAAPRRAAQPWRLPAAWSSSACCWPWAITGPKSTSCSGTCRWWAISAALAAISSSSISAWRSWRPWRWWTWPSRRPSGREKGTHGFG